MTTIFYYPAGLFACGFDTKICLVLERFVPGDGKLVPPFPLPIIQNDWIKRLIGFNQTLSGEILIQESESERKTMSEELRHALEIEAQTLDFWQQDAAFHVNIMVTKEGPILFTKDSKPGEPYDGLVDYETTSFNGKRLWLRALKGTPDIFHLLGFKDVKDYLDQWIGAAYTLNTTNIKEDFQWGKVIRLFQRDIFFKFLKHNNFKATEPETAVVLTPMGYYCGLQEAAHLFQYYPSYQKSNEQIPPLTCAIFVEAAKIITNQNRGTKCGIVYRTPLVAWKVPQSKVEEVTAVLESLSIGRIREVPEEALDGTIMSVMDFLTIHEVCDMYDREGQE